MKSVWRRPILGLVAALLCAFVSSAMAQTESPPRIDPGTPPESFGGSLEGWQVLSVPGLPEGATLGDVWASGEVVYVWARYPAQPSSQAGAEFQGEGERLPDNPDLPMLGSSMLHRFDGLRWTVVLRTPGEAGVAVFGTDRDHLFASTVDPRGEAQLYRFNGSSWGREMMPGRIAGRLHTLAGVAGDLYFRVDRVILRHDGDRLQVAYELPPGEPPMRGLVYLGAGCQFAMGAQGHWLHHEGTWSEVPAGFAFEDVQDAWGMRDEQGRLQMFAVGTDAARCGLRLWRFEETDPATHAGFWAPVLTDPPVGGYPDLGLGLHLWGVAHNEAYATGVVNGEGHMLRFDGGAWVHLSPPVRLGTVHGVWGTAQGVVWFSTESGNLIRYQRGNRPPDLAQARPTVDRLWPPDLRLVPVEIAGLVDLDGDSYRIEITRITQDEALITDDHRSACPDAVVRDARAYLRAEHADGGDGRTYDVEFTATDRLGAASMGRVRVFAPHFVDSACEPDPTPFDAMVGCQAPPPGRRPLETAVAPGGLWIRYELETPATVHLAVYDVAGRLLATLAEGSMAPGAHEARWDQGRHEPGVYFVKLRTRDVALIRRVVVMR